MKPKNESIITLNIPSPYTHDPSSHRLGYLLDASRAENLAKKLKCQTYHPLHVTRAELFLTNRCNMICRYCNSINHPMPQWQSDDLRKTVERLASRGTKHIQWTGGEVTTYPGFETFVSESNALGMNNSISSNGTASYDTYLALVEAGVSHFYFSVDHPNEQFFDFITQTQGKSQAILHTIESLCRYRDKKGILYRIIVNAVLTKRSIFHFLEQNNASLREYLTWCITSGIDDFKFLPASTEPFSELFPTIDDQNRFMELCREMVPSRFAFFHYRLNMLSIGGHGLQNRQHHTCYHFLDDRAYDSIGAYPCIIYLREGGKPLYVYKDSFEAKQQSVIQFLQKNRTEDPICQSYCIDLYRDLSDRVNLILREESKNCVSASNELVIG